MTEDKERDDALIAEARKNLDGTAHGINEYMREVLRLERSGWQPAPKPDRAEALAWMIEGLFAEAADNPCTCASDENSCPHCNAWERATKQTRACIVEAIDELRAEWEAERPAVVVPDDVRAWALQWSDSKSKAGVVSRFILSLDGAKGGE